MISAVATQQYTRCLSLNSQIRQFQLNDSKAAGLPILPTMSAVLLYNFVVNVTVPVNCLVFRFFTIKTCESFTALWHVSTNFASLASLYMARHPAAFCKVMVQWRVLS